MKKRIKRNSMHLGKVLFILLLLTIGKLNAQIVVSASAENPVHFANTDDFSAGILTIQFNMPAGQTSAEVEVTLRDYYRGIGCAKSRVHRYKTYIYSYLHSGYISDLENQTKGYQSSNG